MVKICAIACLSLSTGHSMPMAKWVREGHTAVETAVPAAAYFFCGDSPWTLYAVFT